MRCHFGLVYRRQGFSARVVRSEDVILKAIGMAPRPRLFLGKHNKSCFQVLAEGGAFYIFCMSFATQYEG